MTWSSLLASGRFLTFIAESLLRQNAKRWSLKAVVLPMIKDHGGRIIDTAGDGILAEVGSAVNAAECAVAIQRTMTQRNAEV